MNSREWRASQAKAAVASVFLAIGLIFIAATGGAAWDYYPVKVMMILAGAFLVGSIMSGYWALFPDGPRPPKPEEKLPDAHFINNITKFR